MIADYISQFATHLVQCGIKYSFGVTGSGGSLQLISALEKENVPFYPVAHEAAGVLMSGACCRDGKTHAVAIGIKGPGFINFLPGILSNFYEGYPALTISEAYSTSIPLYNKHKRIDHRSVCSAIVKGYATVDTSADTVQSIFDLASKEFPGPVHLDLCNTPVNNEKPPYKLDKQNQNINESEIEMLADHIKTSSSPVVILGSMVSRQLKGMVPDNLNIPVLTTASAKGCYNENGAYSGGVITGEGKEISPEHLILGKADLIIGIGLRNNEVTRVTPFNATLIIIDSIDDGLHDGFDANICLVTSDVASVAVSVFSELSVKNWGQEVVESYRRRVEKELLKSQWLPPVVFLRLQQQVSENTVLALDTGLFCTIGETVWKARSTDNFIGSSNGRFMGTAIPTAIGTAISNPDQNVICVAGDGGIRPYLSEIRLAVEHHLPILFILMSDGLYGTVAMTGKQAGLSCRAFTINSNSWWNAVESMGCPSTHVSNLQELDRSINQWSGSNGPLFIEMHFEPEQYANLTKLLR